MLSAQIETNYHSIDKPHCLVERHAHCGGTDYFTICQLSDDHARLLHKEGIYWKMGEPDWVEHYRKIEKMKASRDLKKAQARVEELAV